MLAHDDNIKRDYLVHAVCVLPENEHDTILSIVRLLGKNAEEILVASICGGLGSDELEKIFGDNWEQRIDAASPYHYTVPDC